MRSNIVNHVASFVAFGLSFVLFGVFLNSWLSESIAYNQSSPEEFFPWFQLQSLFTAIPGFLFLAFWYEWGSRPKNVHNVGKAGRMWSILFGIEIIIAVLAFTVFAIRFGNEGVTFVQFVICFIAFSMLSALPFWGCSLLMSPRFVKYCPVGRR